MRCMIRVFCCFRIFRNHIKRSAACKMHELSYNYFVVACNVSSVRLYGSGVKSSIFVLSCIAVVDRQDLLFGIKFWASLVLGPNKQKLGHEIF